MLTKRELHFVAMLMYRPICVTYYVLLHVPTFCLGFVCVTVCLLDYVACTHDRSMDVNFSYNKIVLLIFSVAYF